MFPFETHKNTGITKISFEDFIARLEKNVLKNVQYQTDGNFYGKIDIGFAKFELGCKPFKDIAKPIVIMKWNKPKDNIIVETKCRIDNSNHIMILFWLVLGIYVSIKDNNIISIISILVLSIITYLFLYIRYRIIIADTIKKLNELFDILEIEKVEN